VGRRRRELNAFLPEGVGEGCRRAPSRGGSRRYRTRAIEHRHLAEGGVIVHARMGARIAGEDQPLVELDTDAVRHGPATASVQTLNWCFISKPTRICMLLAAPLLLSRGFTNDRPISSAGLFGSVRPGRNRQHLHADGTSDALDQVLDEVVAFLLACHVHQLGGEFQEFVLIEDLSATGGRGFSRRRFPRSQILSVVPARRTG